MKPWTSTFEDATERLLDIALAATPQQRLDWLEDAQKFALESAIVETRFFEAPTSDRAATPLTESKPPGAPEGSEQSRPGSR